jgi:regulator of protease activity HflC (stomatin/prohibitin superfamily)
MTFLAILMIAALVAFKVFFVIVHMRESFVIERLGNFRKVLPPGLHVVLPIVDRIAYRHDTREQVIDIPPQTCITKDNIQVSVDGLVFLKVIDPRLASYGIADYRSASINLAQTTMRAEIGKLSLDESFKEREKLNDAIVKAIDLASEPWGVKVTSYEVRNITPSGQVIHTLEKQMEAERARRAEVTLANAEKESKILTSEGERQEAINISEGERQKRINMAKGKARAMELVADATAQGVRMIGEAVQRPGGDAAVKMRLQERFIQRITLLLQESRVSMMPIEVAQIRGILDSILSGQRPSSGLSAQKKGN